MTLSASSLVATTSRPLAMRMRPDLIARQQRYQGRLHWVVKEPVGLKYFRFQEEEYAILKMIDGKTSLEQIKKRFEKEFAPEKISYLDLQHFIGLLHRGGLVLADASDQGRQLKRRGDEKRRKERLAAMSNVLAFRWKGFDPEWLLNRLYPLTSWFFSRIAIFFCCLLALAALALITVQFDVFYSRLPAFHEFFATGNWIWMAAVLAVTKVLHEFGHGLACKHCKGECHEMGVMLLVFTPCLYCNVSDSWMLPNKWHRAAIGAAGMYVEIVLASIATFAWWFSEPGMLNLLALQVMFICSVSTLLFNGNPLLRYDGYFILADVLEIPNMQQKARSVLQRFLARWCLGLEPSEDPFLPKRNHFAFALYTIVSVCYRWFIVLAILFFLNKVLEPYGLKIIGQMIALMGIFGLVIMPLWKLVKFFHVPGRMDQVKRSNVYATLGVVTVLLLAIGLVPLPRYVSCPLQLQPRDAVSVYADVAGRLEEVFVEPGQQVKAGKVLGRLRNLDLELTLAELTGRWDDYRVQLAGLRKQRFRDKQAGRQIPEIEESLLAIEQQLVEKKKNLTRLHFTAPIAGTVLPPPLPPRQSHIEGTLPEWTGSPLEEKNLGAHLSEGAVFCKIGDPHQLEVMMIIDQEDIELVREGQTVHIMFDSFTGKTFTSQIYDIGKEKLKEIPPSLSQRAGSELATRTDSAGRQKPLSTKYLARAFMMESDELLKVGLRGRAKIYTGRQTLAGRLWRYLAQTFHFQM